MHDDLGGGAGAIPEGGGPPSSAAARATERIETILTETGFEIRLLHERVNALLAAEAFLTIAFTAAMSGQGSWTRWVAPLLAILGFALAAVAWPGIRTTARLVHVWTARLGVVLARHPDSRRGWDPRWEDHQRREAEQRRSSWFFLTVPVAFALVWVLLLIIALVLPR